MKQAGGAPQGTHAATNATQGQLVGSIEDDGIGFDATNTATPESGCTRWILVGNARAQLDRDLVLHAKHGYNRLAQNGAAHAAARTDEIE